MALADPEGNLSGSFLLATTVISEEQLFLLKELLA